MEKELKLPKRYWVYISIMAAFLILMFLNIFLTLALTGGKEISEFTETDRNIFLVFIISELIFLILAFVFALKGGKIVNQKNEKAEPTREESAAMGRKNLCKDLKLLSEPYEVQYEAMEDFARWNLPEETGSTWTDEFEACVLPFLNDFPNVSEEVISLLEKISNNFCEAFKLEQKEYEIIWSHESMKNNSFWENQRNLAKQALDLLESPISNHQAILIEDDDVKIETTID